MQAQTVFFREVGSGPSIVCLHSNASSSSQWRPLMDALAPNFNVLAADSYGAGKSPPWPTDRAIGLRDEVALLEPVFDQAGAAFSLVGHSYGAAIALIAAIEHPDRVQALILYEPTLFALLDAESPQPNDAEGIEAIGWVQRRQGRWQEAVTSIEKAIGLNPRKHDAIANLGGIYRYMRQFPQAERYFDRSKPSIKAPNVLFPEITFRPPIVPSPTLLLFELFVTWIPSVFGKAVFPVISTPI